MNAQKRARKVMGGRRPQRQPGALSLTSPSSAADPLSPGLHTAPVPVDLGDGGNDGGFHQSSESPSSNKTNLDMGPVNASVLGRGGRHINGGGANHRSLDLNMPEESSPIQSPPVEVISAADTQLEAQARNNFDQATTQQVSPPKSPPSADTIQRRPETDVGAPTEVEAETGGAYNSFDADFTAICDELFEEMESGIPSEIIELSNLQEVDSNGLQDTSNGDLGPEAQAAGQPAGFVVGEIDDGEEKTPEKAVESMISPEDVTSQLKRTLAQTATPNEEESEEDMARSAKRQHNSQHQVEVQMPQARGQKPKVPSRANINPAVQSAARRYTSRIPGQTSQQLAADASSVTSIDVRSLENTENDTPAVAEPLPAQLVPAQDEAVPQQPVDYRMVCPTNHQEVQSLQEALQPTREAFFEWTGLSFLATNPYSSYCSQWHEINQELQHWWAAQLPGAEVPDLICREAWFTSLCDWPPFDKNQPEYFKAWKEGHRVPRTADGTPIDIRGRVLERCARLEVRERLMVLNAVLDQMGYAPDGVFFKKIDDDQHDL